LAKELLQIKYVIRSTCQNVKRDSPWELLTSSDKRSKFGLGSSLKLRHDDAIFYGPLAVELLGLIQYLTVDITPNYGINQGVRFALDLVGSQYKSEPDFTNT
jgi:hypothetical protein